MQKADKAPDQAPSDTTGSRGQAVRRALRLRCPACGGGELFQGLFRMASGCPACGLSYEREPGFYLGSIYINYGITVVVCGLLYAAMVLGMGTSSELALGVSAAVAVLLPLVLFRFARAVLLAIDTSINRNQPGHAEASSASPQGSGHDGRELAKLSSDDANAGCLMGVMLVAILAFGLLMAGVTLYFSELWLPPAP